MDKHWLNDWSPIFVNGVIPSEFKAKVKQHEQQHEQQAIALANEQGFYAACGVAGIELSAAPVLYEKYRKALTMEQEANE